jgi:predicted butyrate kinase (DUF1464 family)
MCKSNSRDIKGHGNKISLIHFNTCNNWAGINYDNITTREKIIEVVLALSHSTDHDIHVRSNKFTGVPHSHGTPIEGTVPASDNS